MAEEKRIISVFFVILQSLIYTVFAMDERLDKVKVQCDYLPLINFAIQQNGASIIHQLSIEYTTPATAIGAAFPKVGSVVIFT